MSLYIKIHVHALIQHAARKRAAIVWDPAGKSKSSTGDIEADSKKDRDNSSRSKREEKKSSEREAAHEDRKPKEDKG